MKVLLLKEGGGAMSKKSKYINDKDLYELLKPYAYKVFKDLSNESYRVIEKFYNDYTPTYYQRTYGMKNLFKPSLKRIKNGYRVKFIYSSEYLTTEHRDNDAVFNGSFVYGWHGGKYAWGHLKEKTPRTTPSPWRLLLSYVKEYEI